VALRHRIPSVFAFRKWAEVGGLLSYGANIGEDVQDVQTGRRVCASRCARSKTADVPVEQPTKFELVINLKTAKALGLAVPPTLIARADQAIE
jgi:ABC-type uncharacterized transport system substrate-binding protein